MENAADRRGPIAAGAAQYVWLGIALLVGGLIRFWNLTGPSLFVDEGFVFHIAGQDPRTILNSVAYGDFHPPLFYLMTHYLMRALQWPLWDYRYITAAISLAGILATWAIARRSFGKTAAAIAALAVALSPALITWDRLYRMYAVLVALTALSWWLLLKCGDSRTERRWLWWSLYGAAAIVLPYLHYIGILVIASQFAYTLTKAKTLRPAVFVSLAALLALAPWAWAMRIQYTQAHYALRLDSPEFSGMSVVPGLVAYGIPASWTNVPHFDLVVGCLALTALAGGVYLGRHTILPFWLAPIVIQTFLSFATGINLLLPRYMYVYIPALCICIGCIATFLLQTKYRVAAVALVSGILGVAAIGAYDSVFVPYYQFPDWYQINALLLGNENKNDLIVLVQGAEYWVVKDFSGFRDHAIAVALVPTDIDPIIKWLEKNPQRRVWYIENQPGFTDNKRRIEQALGRTRPRLGTWQQQRLDEEDVVDVFLYGFQKGSHRH